VIGGLTSGYTTWLTQRSQARAGMVAHDFARREDLIRDLIVAASKMYGDRTQPLGSVGYENKAPMTLARRGPEVR
jgi:hypothetical protein